MSCDVVVRAKEGRCGNVDTCTVTQMGISIKLGGVMEN